MVLVSLLEIMPGTVQSKMETLRLKLIDVAENFPCGWLHVQKYQGEFLKCLTDFVEQTPKKETTIGPIKIVSGPTGAREFICRGRRILLWSNDLLEVEGR